VRPAETGEPAIWPTSADNKCGNDIDHDAQGKSNAYVLDLEAISDPLASLREAAEAKGVPIAKVVLYPPIRRRLATTKAWSRISDLPFTQKEAWVRHDDHYHVDFGVKCEASM
jgi:penicillin-insensitive murein endopeptidase